MIAQQVHIKKVASIQKQMRALLEERKLQAKPSPISLNYHSTHSNTTRSRSYKKGCRKLDLGALNEIIQIDPEKRIAYVEPRVTMEQLVEATLGLGLIPPVVPEFKEITVGGAIMGGAGESGSHRFGSFNDICTSLEILTGDGRVITASPYENEDLFYGIPCSYGSLGALLSAAIKLVPAKGFVHLKYYFCSSGKKGIEKLEELMEKSPDFLDGIVFSKDKAVIIAGNLSEERPLPKYSTKPKGAEWYFQHVENLSHAGEEIMPLTDYLFRYDQGAFWVGGFLLRPKLVLRYLLEGILGMRTKQRLSEQTIKQLRSPPRPNAIVRRVLHPLLTTKNLWKLFHWADKWAQTHSILQDFCIPKEKAISFLGEVMDDPGTFPLWLCPIKSTVKPQIFAPHLTHAAHVINVGIYGLPSYYTPTTENVTKHLERKTREWGGKKVLYSRSFYSEEEFWQIYSKKAYEALRAKMGANGVFHGITEKLLSE